MAWTGQKNLADWCFIGVVILLMALFQLLGPETLRYERHWLETGQVWRALTAHWVHVGWTHWLLNCVGLVAMVILTMPGWSVLRWICSTIVMALGISLLMTLFNPEVHDFAGHSGILYGLYLLGAFSLFSKDRLIAVLVGLAIVIKISMEQLQFHDFNTGDLIGARVVVDSHLYGVIMALVIAIALQCSRYTMQHCTVKHSD